MGGHEGGEPEVLEGGHEPHLTRTGTLGIRPWFASMGTGRRRLLAAAVVAVVVAGVLGYGWLRDRPPGLPPVTVSADRSTESVPFWSAGRDGRPAAPMTLSVSVALTDPGRRAGTPQVVPLGLAGPGVRDT